MLLAPRPGPYPGRSRSEPEPDTPLPRPLLLPTLLSVISLSVSQDTIIFINFYFHFPLFLFFSTQDSEKKGEDGDCGNLGLSQPPASGPKPKVKGPRKEVHAGVGPGLHCGPINSTLEPAPNGRRITFSHECVCVCVSSA